MTVYFGGYYTTQWTADLSVSGPRSYDKGKFTWRNDTCQDTTKTVAQALNVGCLCVAPQSGATTNSTIARDLYADVPATATAGLDIREAKLLADDSGVRIWAIPRGDDIYYATWSSDGYSTLAKSTRAQSSRRAFSIMLHGASSTRQYVIVDSAHRRQAHNLAELRPLGHGVFEVVGQPSRSDEAPISTGEDGYRIELLR
jgi:hypothetical protein